MRAHELRALAGKAKVLAAQYELAERTERDHATRRVLRAARGLVEAAAEHVDDQARCSPMGVEVQR